MSKSKKHPLHSHEALMRYARRLGFGDIHTKIDTASGLYAITAIHSTALGPAIGGCRFYPYASHDLAFKDVLRLSYMMTLKAAASDLPHGGAKSVIIKPKEIKDRTAIFRSFGDFINNMNGRYITAMDVGTSTMDMDTIAERTPYVIGAAGKDAVESDPSPFTARGIFRGVQAAVKFKLKRDDLEGLRFAVQGAGHVGYYLMKSLHEHGAIITVCDPNPQATKRCQEEFNAAVVSTEEIYDQPCDVFSPCAIGGTINLDSLNRIQSKIIAGGANNQLAHRKYGALAHKRGVLYAPDFIINAGGLIQAASVYDYHNIEVANRLIEKIYDRLLNLFQTSEKMNQPTTDVAEQMAIQKLVAHHQNI